MWVAWNRCGEPAALGKRRKRAYSKQTWLLDLLQSTLQSLWYRIFEPIGPVGCVLRNRHQPSIILSNQFYTLWASSATIALAANRKYIWVNIYGEYGVLARIEKNVWVKNAGALGVSPRFGVEGAGRFCCLGKGEPVKSLASDLRSRCFIALKGLVKSAKRRRVAFILYGRPAFTVFEQVRPSLQKNIPQPEKNTLWAFDIARKNQR